VGVVPVTVVPAIVYIYRETTRQALDFLTSILYSQPHNSTRTLLPTMDSKEYKDTGAYDDVHVGKPDYQDANIADQVESYQGEEAYSVHHTGLKRGLKSRHIAMISIGGVIGTGLFLGTANSLKNGGPLGLLLGYATVGSICYAVMVSLGEVVAFLPVPGGHIRVSRARAAENVDASTDRRLPPTALGQIRRSCIRFHSRLELLVQLDHHLACRTRCQCCE
jgi:hypothetical protein